MRDPWNDSELVERFRSQARTALPRAPLNSALCTAIADDRALGTLLGHAPLTQQKPVLLLAAIHYLLLAEPDQPLTAWYPNLTPVARDPRDPALPGVLADFVHDRSPAVLELLGTRHVQTNEVGRCALFLPPMSAVVDEKGPIAHIDVGTSAGLTLLIPHYSYRYADGPTIGVGRPRLDCGTRGEHAEPIEMPTIASARGVDLHPLDVTDPDDARWLRACCWPDQIDRFDRLAAAIHVAELHPPQIRRGDAVESIAELVDEASRTGHPVITTSWVLNYLEGAGRRGFVERLDEIGADVDLSWVIAESPAQTPELPHPADLAGEHVTALTLVTWRSGVRATHGLAACHPHGYWMHWR